MKKTTKEILKLSFFLIVGAYLVFTRNSQSEAYIPKTILSMAFCATLCLYMSRIAAEFLKRTFLKPDTD